MNIKFNKIEIHHFLSYDHAEILLGDKGFCLVRGINRNPKDSAKSNGSGKSTIFNAISYALTGETLQGLKSNLPNIAYNDGCWVKLDFDVDGHNYVLLRSRDDEKLGTDLKITIDGQDKSGKGIRESSELLEQYLPDLTSELIGSVILIGQNMPMKFTANTPSGRKEVLEHLTQSDFMIEDLKKRLADRTSKINDYIREQEDLILSASSKETVLSDQVKKYKEEFLEKYTDQKDYDGAIVRLTEEITGLEGKFKAASDELDNLKAKEAEIKPQLFAITDERQKVLDETIKAHNVKMAEYNTKRSDLRASFMTVNNEIKQMENIQDVCPTCGRPFEGVVKPDTTAKKAELAELEQKISLLSIEEGKVEGEHATLIESINNKYAEKVNAVKAEVDGYSAKIRDKSAEYFDLNSKLLAKRSELQTVKTEKEMFEINKKNLADKIADLEGQVEGLIAQMNIVREKKANLDERLGVVNKMNTIVKRDFRGFLLTNIINYVDAKAKFYASKIFGCSEVDFTLDGNNIDIAFCGKDYENLSGGEKQRLDLIIQFAIRDFISQYLSFSCNILVLDEITDALDSESCEKVVNFIIEELSSVESVFIISHHADELELPRDSEIVVEKTADGISRVVA